MVGCSQTPYPDRFLTLLKIRLKDVYMYTAEWREGARSRTSFMVYREIKNVFEISDYRLLQIKIENTDKFCVNSTSPPTN